MGSRKRRVSRGHPGGKRRRRSQPESLGSDNEDTVESYQAFRGGFTGNLQSIATEQETQDTAMQAGVLPQGGGTHHSDDENRQNFSPGT